jgi:Uma2 family endonuclease
MKHGDLGIIESTKVAIFMNFSIFRYFALLYLYKMKAKKMQTEVKNFYEKIDLEQFIKGKSYLLLNEQAILFWHEKEKSYVVGKINPQKRYTAEDYSQLPENAPYQLINYHLVYMPSPFNTHQRVSKKLVFFIETFLYTHQIGELFYAPADVYFDNGNVYQPDIFYVSEQRKSIVTDKYTYGAPDFIVEILSESTAHQDYNEKMKVYGKYEVFEYWIVDILSKTIEVYHHENGEMKLAQKAGKQDKINSLTISGLAINVNEIFS